MWRVGNPVDCGIEKRQQQGSQLIEFSLAVPLARNALSQISS